MYFPFKTLLQFVTLLFVISACTQIPQAGYKNAITIAENAHPSPILFSKLKLGLPAGSDVGTVSDFGLDQTLWFSVPANRSVLQKGLSKKELSRVFNDALEGQGYDVVRHLDLTFDEEVENEFLRTQYKIGGKIIDAKMNANYDSRGRIGNIVYGREGLRGELYLKIEWSVYDALRRTTVYKTVTEGTGESTHPDAEGMILIVNAAFAVAAHNLAADEGFHNLITKGIKPNNYPPKKKHDDRPLKYKADEDVSLNAPPLSTSSITKNIDKADKNSVLVQAGAGHGSGFFITKDGHILTNNHVVGNAQRVRIVTSGKKDKLVAQVLRVDRARDVALLKLEDMPKDLNITLMPVRLDWPAVSEDIYALGAPKSTRLQGSLSKGIVSAHRKDYKTLGSRENFIQGDVPIHGGNSGGPLFDAHGNIIGISVIGLYMHEGKRSADLNLFIPVREALDRLGITY